MRQQQKPVVFDRSELPFPMYEREESVPVVFESVINSLRVQMTPLNRAFFSKKNLDRIQARLRQVIQQKLGYGISRQSDDQLLIIMRAVYMQHGDHLPDSVGAELARLNDIVVAESAPIIAANVRAYLVYLEDASRIPPPLERSVNTSIKGTRTLEMYKKNNL